MKLLTLALWRRVIPCFMLAAFIIVFWRHQYPLPADASALLWFSRLDPLLLLAEWRSTGAFPGWFWLPFVMLIITLAGGRLFCGWLCPLGGLLALLPRRYSRLQSISGLYRSRYAWLLVVLLLLLAGSSWPLFLTPFHLLTEELSRIWQGQMPWMLSGIILSGIFIYPRFWCNHLCPTGLLLAATARWRSGRLVVDNACSRCGVCTKVCPTHSVQSLEGMVTENCMVCGQCWQNCPQDAINWRSFTVPKADDHSPADLSRRQFFKGGLAVCVAGAGWPLLQPSAALAVLRPPGAVAEAEFLARCSRCSRCVKVCPSQCLVPMPIEAGLTAFLTPRIIPRQAKCELCLLCQDVCPTMAIEAVPLQQVKIGLAALDEQRCLVWAEKKLCLLCREQCPVHAIEADEHNRPYVNNELCVGCGGCENGCPLKQAAIVVRPI